MMHMSTKAIQRNCESGDSHGDLLTTGRLSQYLGCSERHIYNLRRRGLPAIEIGDMVRFDLAAVRRWLAVQQKRAGKQFTA